MASPHKRPRYIASNRDKERKWVNSLRGSKAPRPPSYNDTNAVRLGPPSAARKLLFAPAKSPAPSPPPGFENHPLALAANPSAGDQNQKGWTTTPSTATPLATPMLQKEAVLKPSVPSTEPTGDVELFQGTSKPVANHPSVKKPKKWTKISRADQAGKQDEVARNDVKERGKRSYRETEVEEAAGDSMMVDGDKKARFSEDVLPSISSLQVAGVGTSQHREHQ